MESGQSKKRQGGAQQPQRRLELLLRAVVRTAKDDNLNLPFMRTDAKYLAGQIN
jgi:hypothetical protein